MRPKPPGETANKMEYQDWNPVILHGKSTPKQHTTVPKQNPIAQHLAKIEREDFVKSKTLSHESRIALQQARLAQKKTQKEMDQLCSFPANTFSNFESGRSTPNGSQLTTINRVLKISLKLS